MPATAARIGFITKEYRLVTAGPDAGVESAFGTLARKTIADEPVESFFLDNDDTQAMADERLALLSKNMRRFPTTLSGAADFAFGLDYSQTIPVANVIDPRTSIDVLAAIVSIRVDLAKGAVQMTAWGYDRPGGVTITAIDGGSATSVPADAIDGGSATSVPADAYDGGNA